MVDVECGRLRDRLTLSKALSLAELDSLTTLLRYSACLVKEPRSSVVGITGPQGVGKSSLISAMIKELTQHGYRVAALLVDPSSPMSGGAVLGNRIRMPYLPEEAFVRSIWAENERSVPLRAAVSIELLEAAGYDYIVVETPGAGQVNTDILRISDLVVVVLMPLLGDEVQVIKAGMMEIGDLYVVNKSDIPESELMYNYVKSLVKGKPVIKVSALYRTNLGELVSTVEQLLGNRRASGDILKKRMERRRFIVEEALKEFLETQLRSSLSEVPPSILVEKPDLIPEVISSLKASLVKRLSGGPVV
ncbi:MAG: methylmalonyl Co-A mutase-associated GTPase MeaB [Desulfurococcaceae archaeon]|nr:methylmalonyl Co-A mutase-associated GTPase MeaB [Desulfurococcaceae archaeon]